MIFKPSKSVAPCLIISFMFIASACKTNPNNNLDSTAKVVGGRDIADDSYQATVPILTGCTGTFVTLDEFPVKNYVLTTTKCANEITSRDTRGMSKREAVMQELDNKDEHHSLGLIDYAWLKNPKTGKAPTRKPTKINLNPSEVRKGQAIRFVGYGCQAIDNPETDFDYSHSPQKRIGANTIDTVDMATGLITFKGPKSNAPIGKATICPRTNMPEGETADEGAPVIWDGRVGAIALYSKVVGNEIITTAKLLSYPTTTAFLKKWLRQDDTKVANQDAIVATPSVTMWHQNNIYTQSVGSIGAGQRDWASGYNKMTCYEGQHAGGVKWVNGISFTAQLFCQSNSKNSGKWLTNTAQLIAPKKGNIYNRHTQGDWGPGSEKFECPKGSFLGGLAKARSSLTLNAILCVQSSQSSQYQHDKCRGISTGNTGRTFAQCGPDEYIGGVTFWWGGLEGHLAHVLCCKF